MIKLSPGTKGALAELRAHQHFLELGWFVFPSQCDCPIDFIAWNPKDGETLLLDVKKMSGGNKGSWYCVPLTGAQEKMGVQLCMVYPDRVKIGPKSEKAHKAG